MQPYVIRQGDYLLQLANALGFDQTSIWQDDKNSDLSQSRRPGGNILCPGDVLYVPDPPLAPPDGASLNVGTTNSFVSNAPLTTINIKFTDDDLASQPCTIAELDQLTNLATDGSGLLTFQAPVTLTTATITFTAVNQTCSCLIGHLDPVDTLTGVYQRLQNLGYIDDGLEINSTAKGLVQGGLWLFEAANGGGGSGASAAAPPPSPSSQPAPDSAPPPSSSPPPSSAPPPSSDASPSSSAPPSSGSPPSSDPVPNSSPASLYADGADNYKLDDSTATLLLTAHGC
jgi:hypothetical protein